MPTWGKESKTAKSWLLDPNYRKFSQITTSRIKQDETWRSLNNESEEPMKYD